MRSVVGLGACFAFCLVAGTSAAAAKTTDVHAAAGASLKPLKVSINFTKSRYAPHARAHIDITLKNTGSVKLHPIGAFCDRAGNPDELNNRGRNWGVLAASARGVTLAPHSSRVFQVTATVPAAAQRAGQVVVACDFGYRNVETGYRPQAYDTARVPGQSGALAGTIGYVTKSGATAGLGGVRVFLIDPTLCPLRKRTATTGPKGRFEIAHAPAGASYKLYFFLPNGWKMSTAHSNPTHAMIFGNDTTRYSFQVKRGTARRPSLPTKCSRSARA